MASDLTFNIAALDRASAVFVALSEKVDKFGAKLDALDGKKADPKVDVDVSEANKKLDDLNAKSKFTGVNMGQAIAAGVAVSGPLVGAAFVGLGVAGLAGLGAVLVKGDPRVQAGWQKLVTDAKATGTDVAAGMVTPLVGAMGQIDGLLTSEAPVFRSMFNAAAQDIQPLTTGLVGLVQNALPGLDAAMSRSLPIAQSLGQVERDVGTAVSAVGQSIASSSGQMGSDLNQVGGTVKIVGGALGTLVQVTTGLAAGALPVLNAALGTTSQLLAGVSTVLGPLEPLIGGAGLAGVAGWKLLPPVLSGVLGASKSVGEGMVNAGAKVEGLSPKLANVAQSAALVTSTGIPLVAMLGAASLAFAALGHAEQEEAQHASETAAGAKTVADALRASKGVIDETTRATTAAGLQGQDWVKSLTSQGISLKDITDAALGVPGALQKVNTEVGHLGGAASTADNILKGVSFGLLSNGDASNKAKDALGVLNGVYGQAESDNKSLADAIGKTTTVLTAQGPAVTGVQSFWNTYDASITSTAQGIDAATSGVKKLVDAQVSANSGFFSAQSNWASLDAAVSSAARSYQSAATAIGTAQHGVGQAAQGVAAAQHAEEQAARGVIAAQNGVAAAEDGVTQAEGAYNVALGQEKVAQDSLAAARAAAAQQLKDLQRQVTDSADTEHAAELRLLDAKDKVKAAGLAGKTVADLGALTDANRTQFQLLSDLEAAQHNYNDTMAASAKLAEQNAAAQAAGVDGNQGVISATQGVTSAQQSAASAAKALAQSQAAVATASQAVRDAQYQEQQAHLATENAVFAEHQASAQLSQAKDAESLALAALGVAKSNDSRSTDINTSAGARNFTQIEQMYEANLAATGSVGDATTATMNQTTQLGFNAGAVQGVIDRVRGLNGMQAQFGIVGLPSVNLSSIINAANAQGLDPRQLGFTSQQIGNARADMPMGSHYAGGGLFRGQGSTTSDSNVIAVSDREYIVNARSTAKHLPLIEAINNDELPSYARGGLSGTGRAIIKGNLELAELGAMGEALSQTMVMLGGKGSGLRWPTDQINPVLVPMGFGGGNGAPATSGNVAAEQAYAASQMGRYGWGQDQMPYLIRLWNQESNWNPLIVNRSSGAYGIPQSLPASKMASAGPDWPTNANTQINWGLGYIAGRYGDPAGAWSHEVSHNWYAKGGLVGALASPRSYDNGGKLNPGWNLAYNGTGRPENARPAAAEDALLVELRGLREDNRQLRAAISGQRPITVHSAQAPGAVAAEVSRQQAFALTLTRRG